MDPTNRHEIDELTGSHQEAVAAVRSMTAEVTRLRALNAELVGALEAIANETCDHGPGQCARDVARAAIAKARS